MAVLTLKQMGIRKVIDSAKTPVATRTMKSDGATAKPGYIVKSGTDPTAGDATLVTAKGDLPLGIVLETYDRDIDTAYPDNYENLPVLLIAENPGAVVWILTAPNIAAIKPGDPVQVDDSVDGAATATSAADQIWTIGYFVDYCAISTDSEFRRVAISLSRHAAGEGVG